MPDWLYDGLIKWLAERVVDMLGALMSLLSDTLFRSPDVTVFPQVQQLAGRSLAVVNAVYVLAVVTAGVLQMIYGTLQIRYQVKDLLPRLVVGLIAANFGLVLCQQLIEVANALSVALAGEAASGPQVVQWVQQRLLIAMVNPAAGILAVVLALLIVVMIYQLLVGLFLRIAVLIVVAGVAPVALACHGLPQTQPVAALWWRSLLGCLCVPGLQAAFFSTGVGLLLGPVYSLPHLLGLTTSVGLEVVHLFAVLCLLVVTIRIPRMVARYVTQPRPDGSAAVLVRAAAMQVVMRRAGLR
ncbi:hypothetical protein [Actinoplanes couchii]|uniref:TrbL/VirB6 plasmid conjugal transfer protein n=1 Tax=Actinoplanes couchii TaxID=403638 RepID=A0ABQ3XRK6_9ACTN|nr:hypothetical protein [Actinoplanes couchii]MDR6318910.1 hypothetical protein [Actinoplanes couchii]GID61151.1 hypothetical protein Aco03nite_095550 [Actinoplanes couchii]